MPNQRTQCVTELIGRAAQVDWGKNENSSEQAESAENSDKRVNHQKGKRSASTRQFAHASLEKHGEWQFLPVASEGRKI